MDGDFVTNLTFGSKFISDHIIEVTKKSIDDFAGADIDKEQIKKILGL